MSKYLSVVCLTLLGVSPAMADSNAVAAQNGAAAVQPKSSASASGSSAAVEEILVTAQKRSENVQNVPIAITALNASQLQAMAVLDTLSLPKATPGLQFNVALAGIGQPRIRGVGSVANGPGIENPVALYVDGVYLAAPASTLFSLTDIEQVAVLKGPQGTLFGRNATGGLLQVTTRQPSQTFHLDAHGTYGNKETTGGDLYVTGGITSNLAGSLAVYYGSQGKGFGKNLFDGRDVGTYQNWAVRPKLAWVGDNDRLTLSADFVHNRQVGPVLVPVQPTFATGTIPPGGPFGIDQDVTPLFLNVQYGGSITEQHDFAKVQLKSITAFRQNKFHAVVDDDTTTVSPFTSPGGGLDEIRQRDKQFSEELQLLSTGPGRFKWIVGGIYFWGEGTWPNVLLVQNFGFGPAFDHIYANQRLNSVAGYGQASYSFAEGTTVTGGIRYTMDARVIDASSDGFGQFPYSYTAHKQFQRPSWRLAVDHRFSDEVLGYVSWNRGFKSGAFAPAGNTPDALRPEVLDAYEAGLKTDLLNRRLRFNLAVYYYNYKNVQVDLINTILQIFNARGSHSYGVDADGTFRVTRNLSVNFGASYIHDRFTRFQNGYTLQPLPFGGNQVVMPFDDSFHRLQQTPDWTVNLGLLYVLPTQVGDFTFAGSYYHSSSYFTDPDNRLRQPAYNVVDGSILWVTPSGKYDARLWAKNMTDTVYAVQLTETTHGDTLTPAPGRTYGVTVGLHF